MQSVTINGMAVSAAGDVYSFTAEENGDYLISAADKNGNVTNQTVTVDKIDKTKPVIGTIQMSNPDVVELEKTLTFTVTDGEGAGVREVTVNDVPVSAVNGVYSHLITANGSYTIRAVDNAGNEAAPSQVTVSNIQVPQLTFISQTPDAGTPTNQDVVVRFSVKDLGSRTLAVSPSGTITAVDKAKGIYQFSVSANGEYTVTAGSEATPLKVTVSNIDKEPPTYTEKEKNQWMSIRTVYFEISDPNGIETPQVKDPYDNPIGVSLWGSGIYYFTAEVNGDYAITISDLLGNETTQIYTENKIKPGLYRWTGSKHLWVTIGSSGYYSFTTYIIQDRAEKSSEIVYQYSLSCVTERMEDNPALTSGNEDAVYIRLEDALKQGKLELTEVEGLPGYQMELTPGNQYFLWIQPIDKNTGELFPDPLPWDPENKVTFTTTITISP